MKYLIDTNICIFMIKKKPEKVINKFLLHQPGDIAISIITLSELKYGVYKSLSQAKNAIALEQFIQPLQVLEFNEDDADMYGKISAKLELKGEPIGAMDMLIAAQAKSRNLILITDNEKEFKRVEKLKIENWAK